MTKMAIHATWPVQPVSVEEAAKKLEESDSSSFDPLVIKYVEDARGCNIPKKDADHFTRGMAMEGYWGW